MAGVSDEAIANMDCENFQALYLSIKRVQARNRMWQLNAMAVAANPDAKGKNVKNMMQALEHWIPYAEIKQQMGSAKDFRKMIKKG